MAEMMRISWRVDKKEKAELDRIFEVTEKAAGRKKDLFQRILPLIRAGVHSHFTKESGPDGRWQALNPIYSLWKEQNFPGQPILQLRHRLFSAATRTGAAGNITEITNRYLEFGVDLGKIPYARVHDLGGQAGRGRRSRMPKREFMFLDTKEQEVIAKEAWKFVWDEGLAGRPGGAGGAASLSSLLGV